MKKIFICFCLIMLLLFCSSGNVHYNLPANNYRKVYSGLENFIENYSEKYRGKKAAIVTNHSGVDFNLKKNIDLLREKGLEIVMAFAPEHGLYGYQNAYDTRLYNVHQFLNIIVYNLHKLDVRRLRYLLKVADIVIFDIQDMGMRCYTYISSLKMVMDALSPTNKELIVFDRPNPLGFLGVDGPYLEKRFYTKFISAFPSTFLYDMTMGEAAYYYKRNYAKNLNLTVIELTNYKRDMLYNETLQPWIPPSPNLPTYESSIVYSGVVLLEGIKFSLGRGTPKPFEYIGAPWIEPVSFCQGLEKLGFKNFRFRPVFFEPTFSKYKGRKCGGVQIFYIGGRFSPTEFSYKLLKYIKANYNQFIWERYGGYYDIDALAGTDKFRKAINRGKSFEEYLEDVEPGIDYYKKLRSSYLLYD